MPLGTKNRGANNKTGKSSQTGGKGGYPSEGSKGYNGGNLASGRSTQREFGAKSGTTSPKRGPGKGTGPAGGRTGSGSQSGKKSDSSNNRSGSTAVPTEKSKRSGNRTKFAATPAKQQALLVGIIGAMLSQVDAQNATAYYTSRMHRGGRSINANGLNTTFTGDFAQGVVDGLPSSERLRIVSQILSSPPGTVVFDLEGINYNISGVRVTPIAPYIEPDPTYRDPGFQQYYNRSTDSVFRIEATNVTSGDKLAPDQIFSHLRVPQPDLTVEVPPGAVADADNYTSSYLLNDGSAVIRGDGASFTHPLRADITVQGDRAVVHGLYSGVSLAEDLDGNTPAYLVPNNDSRPILGVDGHIYYEAKLGEGSDTNYPFSRFIKVHPDTGIVSGDFGLAPNISTADDRVGAEFVLSDQEHFESYGFQPVSEALPNITARQVHGSRVRLDRDTLLILNRDTEVSCPAGVSVITSYNPGSLHSRIYVVDPNGGTMSTKIFDRESVSPSDVMDPQVFASQGAVQPPAGVIDQNRYFLAASLDSTRSVIIYDTTLAQGAQAYLRTNVVTAERSQAPSDSPSAAPSTLAPVPSTSRAPSSFAPSTSAPTIPARVTSTSLAPSASDSPSSAPSQDPITVPPFPSGPRKTEGPNKEWQESTKIMVGVMAAALVSAAIVAAALKLKRHRAQGRRVVDPDAFHPHPVVNHAYAPDVPGFAGDGVAENLAAQPNPGQLEEAIAPAAAAGEGWVVPDPEHNVEGPVPYDGPPPRYTPREPNAQTLDRSIGRGDRGQSNA